MYAYVKKHTNCVEKKINCVMDVALIVSRITELIFFISRTSCKILNYCGSIKLLGLSTQGYLPVSKKYVACQYYSKSLI